MAMIRAFVIPVSRAKVDVMMTQWQLGAKPPYAYRALPSDFIFPTKSMHQQRFHFIKANVANLDCFSL